MKAGADPVRIDQDFIHSLLTGDLFGPQPVDSVDESDDSGAKRVASGVKLLAIARTVDYPHCQPTIIFNNLLYKL